MAVGVWRLQLQEHDARRVPSPCQLLPSAMPQLGGGGVKVVHASCQGQAAGGASVGSSLRLINDQGGPDRASLHPC